MPLQANQVVWFALQQTALEIDQWSYGSSPEHQSAVVNSLSCSTWITWHQPSLSERLFA